MTFDEALQQIMEENPGTREVIEYAIKLAEEEIKEKMETLSQKQ